MASFQYNMNKDQYTVRPINDWAELGKQIGFIVTAYSLVAAAFKWFFFAH